MKKKEFVVLVDLNDNPKGTAEKLRAHQLGLCHRAFSIFIFRPAEAKTGQLSSSTGNAWELLLQQRSEQKYHGGGLWTNTCCSHPKAKEDLLDAAKNRLKMEMGFTTQLYWVGRFHYQAVLQNGLIENEVDHVLVGFYDLDHPTFNRQEVKDIRWCNLSQLSKELTQNPHHFTPWLKKALTLAYSGLSFASDF